LSLPIEAILVSPVFQRFSVYPALRHSSDFLFIPPLRHSSDFLFIPPCAIPSFQIASTAAFSIAIPAL
ncbi:MAG: hypothetical protein LUI07_00680, partial [Lachnospiraceae bacterium]|nr:hypothetical protein [Lachnospiraceae bacterium]